MKRLKYIISAMFLLILTMPNVLAAQPYAYVSCGEATGIPAPIPLITSIAYTLLIVATPLILIIMSIVALAKAVVAQKADDIVKVRSTLIKKIVATALVFMVAGIAQFIITRAADDSEAGTLTACLSCYLYHQECAHWEHDLSYISDPNTNQHANTSGNQGHQNNNNPNTSDATGTYNPTSSNCLSSGSYTSEPNPRCVIEWWKANGKDLSVVYLSDSSGRSLGAWPADHNSKPTTRSDLKSSVHGSLVLPMSGVSISSDHTWGQGVDMHAAFGEPVYAPADGTLSFSSWGRTSHKGYYETAYSVIITLTNPFYARDKNGTCQRVTSIFMTHMSGIRYRCGGTGEPACSVSVKKGDIIGYVGTASGADKGWAPHLHMNLSSTGEIWWEEIQLVYGQKSDSSALAATRSCN